MKKILSLLFIFALIIGVTGCENVETKKEQKNDKGGYTELNKDSKSLVLYFSATGTTEKVAKMISEATNSNIIEIVPKDKYISDDLNYNKDDTRANREMNDLNARPEIENEINIVQYDTIYIGYPIWWGTNPRIILTLLDNVDFKGKNVALFCTSGGSGIEQSVADLKEYNSEVNWLGGRRFSSNVSQDELQDWINSLNY